MHDYAFDPELVRLAILLGVIVSMLFYERYALTTAGVIVPGYLALFVPRPVHILATLGIAFAVYWIIYKVLRPRLMLWGRRLFETEILVTLLLTSIWLGLLLWLAPLAPQLLILYGVGFLLPGIIAHDMGRQGVRATLTGAGGATFAVFGLIALAGAFRDILGLPASLLTPSATPSGPYGFPVEWLFIAVIFSVLASVFLYRRGLLQRVLLPGSLRAGGFITAAYLALFVTRPLDLAFALACSALTYLIVTQFLMKQAILFGRSKMAVMFLAGMAVTWAAELVLGAAGTRYLPWAGFNAIAPTIVALLANDAERQGPGRTLLGAGLSTGAVFAAMMLLSYAYHWLR